MSFTNQLSFVKTLKSKLSDLSLSNGRILFLTDTGEFFIENENSRIKITDFSTLDTESELNNILVPLDNKFYFTKDSNKIWIYNNIEENWNCLNNDYSDEITKIQQDIVNLKSNEIEEVKNFINGIKISSNVSITYNKEEENLIIEIL